VDDLTTSDVPAERLTLGHFLDDVAERYGDRPAIHFGDRELGYRDLRSESRRLARALAARGVVKGARVAVMMANRPEWAVAAFATGMLGAVLVPINTFATSRERDYILRHSDASFLLLQPRLLTHRFLESLLADHPGIARAEPGRIRLEALPQLRRVVSLEGEDGGLESYSELLSAGDDVTDELLDALQREVHPSDDCCIIYTSGTTSDPKGVLHAHRAPVLQAWRFSKLVLLTPEDRLYTAYPFFWTAGMAMSLMGAMAGGSKLVLHETFDAEAALRAVEEQRVTTIHAWPHQHKAMAEHPGLADRDLSSLVKLDAFSALKPHAGVKEDDYGIHGSAYGLTETFTIASMTPADADPELRKQTSGRPMPGTLFRIVDPESGAPLPQGQEGEIALKGQTFMRGYYKKLPEEFLDADGFFHTQDGGYFDAEGYLHWHGRISNMIKTGGANVSPIEIEEVAGEMPELRLAHALGMPHPTLGEVIVLCAVKAGGAETDEAGVRAFLGERLARYKLPRCVLFFEPEQLSFTGTSKVQVAPLREAAQRRLADEGVEIDGHRYSAPA
jgi:acyl-CoA synthetase (AMP-forming)/AMP-acid ligase II